MSTSQVLSSAKDAFETHLVAAILEEFAHLDSQSWRQHASKQGDAEELQSVSRYASKQSVDSIDTVIHHKCRTSCMNSITEGASQEMTDSLSPSVAQDLLRAMQQLRSQIEPLGAQVALLQKQM